MRCLNTFTFTCDMNETLSKDITERELSAAVSSMAKGKAPRYDGIPIDFPQKLWSIVGNNFHRMILNSFKKGALHAGVTMGLISLIPKKKDAKDLNYGRPITLLTNSYKIFAKTIPLPYSGRGSYTHH